jgi:hypothetical protein
LIFLWIFAASLRQWLTSGVYFTNEEPVSDKKNPPSPPPVHPLICVPKMEPQPGGEGLLLNSYVFFMKIP